MVDPSSLKQSFQADAKILTCSLSIDKGLMEKEAQRQQHLKSKKRKLDAAEEKSMQLELIQKLAGNEEATRKKKLDLESQKLQKIQEKQNKKTEKKQKIQAMKRQALNQLLQKESVSTKDSKSIPPKSEKRRVRFADE